jgi:hypothetical protein
MSKVRPNILLFVNPESQNPVINSLFAGSGGGMKQLIQFTLTAMFIVAGLSLIIGAPDPSITTIEQLEMCCGGLVLMGIGVGVGAI